MSFFTNLSKKSYFPWLELACATSFFAFQFILRVSPSVFAKDMMNDLNIDECTFGGVASFFYVGYTGLQIVAGLLLDKFGVRKPLTLAILLCFGGALIFATGATPFLLSIGRLLMGIGGAFGFLSCMKIATAWFPANKLGMVIGVSMLVGSAGAVSGGAPLAIMAGYLGWQESMLILAFVGLLIALASWLVVSDHSRSPNLEAEDLPIFEALKIILCKPQTYVFAIFASLIYLALSIFADLWGPYFVSQVYGISDIEAAGVVSTIYIGFGFSGLLTAVVAKKMQSYKQPMIYGAIVTLIGFSAIIYFPIFSIEVLCIILFFVGLFLGSNIFSFACVCELNPKSISGTASGVQNTFQMVSGIICQPLVGHLLKYFHQGSGSEHSVLEYQYALSVVPIAVFLALLMTFRMRELYPKS